MGVRVSILAMIWICIANAVLVSIAGISTNSLDLSLPTLNFKQPTVSIPQSNPEFEVGSVK
jgi:hypothetical protein